MGKETVIHTDHQPLQFLQSQSKLQQSRHFRWMGFLQQFHLLINKVVDMLSRHIVSATTLLNHNSVLHESYIEKYALYNGFKNVYKSLSQGNHVEGLDYHLHDNLLYHLGKLCIPQGERLDMIHHKRCTYVSY